VLLDIQSPFPGEGKDVGTAARKRAQLAQYCDVK